MYNMLIVVGKTGAGEGIRTLDPNLGNIIWCAVGSHLVMRSSTIIFYNTDICYDVGYFSTAIDRPLCDSIWIRIGYEAIRGGYEPSKVLLKA